MRNKLIIFFILHTTISFFLLIQIPKGEHGNLLYIPILLIFWTLSLFLLYLIYNKTKADFKPKWTNLLLTICTPIPIIIYLIGWLVWTNNFENKTLIKYYKLNDICIKRVNYLYQKKTEYWSNFDSPNNEYLLDSIISYDNDKKKFVTDVYKDWQRLKGDTEIARCDNN